MLTTIASNYALFVGRNIELDEINTLTQSSSCHLLTLVGPGGIGKTRLAIEVAQRQKDTFADGVYFVALQPLHSHEFIISAIAESLRFQPSPNYDLSEQLLEYISDKSLLLVIDNFEHLLDGAHLLSQILARAPFVKILATSRERLNLVEEWVYEVGGLSFPANERESDIEGYSAVQLFIQNARRVHNRFTLTKTHKTAISRICRIVGGMPLAIELSSAWVRALPCEIIAEEIQRSLDILETNTRNALPRHRNIRAAFEPTWNHLSEKERSIFTKLSVFRGEFTREAATFVAGAELHTLSTLVDKSLLRLNTNGYYSIHELLRQFGEEHLKNSPDDYEQTLDLHRVYFMEMLAECELDIVFFGRQKEGISKIHHDLENIHTAWRRAVEQVRYDEIVRAVEGLWSFY